MNTEGISVYGSLVDMAVTHEIITKAGAFFKINDQNIQGREGAKKYLKENPKIATKIREDIWKKVKSDNENPKTEALKN
jgi:recombination protein RecA